MARSSAAVMITGRPERTSDKPRSTATCSGDPIRAPRPLAELSITEQPSPPDLKISNNPIRRHGFTDCYRAAVRHRVIFRADVRFYHGTMTAAPKERPCRAEAKSAAGRAAAGVKADHG